MDSSVLEWARSKLREEVGVLADDPHGYCGSDISFIAAWEHLAHVARHLGMDAQAVLLEDRTPHEISRLGRLIGRDFG